LHYNAVDMKQRINRLVSNTQAHPAGWACVEQDRNELASLGRRSDAAGADFHFRRLAVLNHRYRLEVWVEAAAGMPLRKADRIAKGWAFAAASALCHE
jgi:hypothetical protein